MVPTRGPAAYRVVKASGLPELNSVIQRIEDWKAGYVDGHITVGRKPGTDSIVLASNDYLSIARDPRIIQAIADGLYGAGGDVFMSSVYVQYLDVQREYESEMARHLGTEAVVLCQSGWAANDGLIQSLADSDVPVYIDLYAHASLWQGVHSAGAKPRPFRHNDPESLAATVKRHGPGLIAVDAVYSTNGDICPLREIVEIAERYGCMTVVDESHAVGIRGPAGAGLASELDLVRRINFRTFSLSKAFVGRGGIVAGPAAALEYFRYQSRPAIFSSAVLPYETMGFAAALKVVQQDDWRRAAVRRNSDHLRTGLDAAGCRIATNDSPIIALVAGTEERTAKLRDSLEARNVFGAVFCAPATPKERSLVRLTVNAAVEPADLDRVIEACAAIKRESGII